MTAKTPLNLWVRSLRDLTRLVYPENCVVCEQELAADESCCCVFCLNELPYTHFEKYKEPTPLDQLFWGRVQLEGTFSLLHFEKGRSSQKILHQLKYGNNKALGRYMGRIMGERIKMNDSFASVDLLIPVPIHHRKAFNRGYNQSEALVEGMSEITGIPYQSSAVIKTRHTSSQTNKGRFLRWDNVSEQFSLHNPLPSGINHVALVDDVITTGATLESLVRTFQKNYPDLRMSIISLALTT